MSLLKMLKHTDDIEDNQRYRDDGIKEVQRRSKSYKEELSMWFVSALNNCL